MTARWRLGVGLVLAGAATTAGFFAHHLMSPPPPKPATHQYAERLPTLTLPDLDGAPRALSEWKGRPLLINFWATWCEPCREEIPLLKQLRADHAADGLEVLGIAIDFRDAVAAYARETGIAYPVLIAEEDGAVNQAFGVRGVLPTTVFVARDGRIVGVKMGQLRQKQIDRLLAEVLKAP